MLDYLAERPTADEVLRLVHGIKVTTAAKLRKGMEQVDQSSFEKEFWTPEVGAMGYPERLDAGFRESVEFFNNKIKPKETVQ